MADERTDACWGWCPMLAHPCIGSGCAVWLPIGFELGRPEPTPLGRCGLINPGDIEHYSGSPRAWYDADEGASDYLWSEWEAAQSVDDPPK